MEALALGCRGGAVCLWKIGEHEFTDWARDEDGQEAAAIMLFNPSPTLLSTFLRSYIRTIV